METAYAQIFDGPDKPLRPLQRPLSPSCADGEILVKIDLATICGSDIHTLLGHRKEPTPCILGHEGLGTVLAVGAKRKDAVMGDRITWSIADSCGSCPACTTYQLPQKCSSLFKYGHSRLPDDFKIEGCYASHIFLRKGTHVVQIPEELSDSVVAPANCALATMVNAVSRIPKNCRAAVVQGAGLLGLYACALLKEQGLEQVFCADINDDRLKRVTAFGAIPINSRTDKDRVERICKMTNGGVDVVLEVAGTSQIISEGIDLLRPGGFYGFIGMVHPDSKLTFTGEQIIRKCLTIFGIHNYAPIHLDQSIVFLQQTYRKYPYESLISPPYALSELQKAFHAAQSQQWPRISVKP
jgi:putative phosphonate catabolism associated alcohol dehydrogenase